MGYLRSTQVINPNPITASGNPTTLSQKCIQPAVVMFRRAIFGSFRPDGNQNFVEEAS